ncbi:hypothetical protein Pint_30649 [Pistacia integerrima]|uniref:Uncharacterized protein n=1 Tax=Pistacia integerrima TaxID=434235 RepID=A0ACC0WYK6_9ROSI|nr:hypothetical protein Pint_30649 [Pistacia integerrima]
MNFRLPTDYHPKPNYSRIITNYSKSITANTIISNKSSFKWSVRKKILEAKDNPYIIELPPEDSTPELVVESQGLSAVEAKNLAQSLEKPLVLKRPREADNFSSPKNLCTWDRFLRRQTCVMEPILRTIGIDDVDNEGGHKYNNGMEMAKEVGLIKPPSSP